MQERESNGEQLKIIPCTRDKAEKKENERGREREEGWRSPLEHPQSTSPEQCINISHTQNKRLGTQPAHSQRRERGRRKML